MAIRGLGHSGDVIVGRVLAGGTPGPVTYYAGNGPDDMLYMENSRGQFTLIVDPNISCTLPVTWLEPTSAKSTMKNSLLSTVSMEHHSWQSVRYQVTETILVSRNIHTCSAVQRNKLLSNQTSRL